MGFIYKIWNEQNNKLYIGQTSVGITARWSQHLKQYLTNNAVLYRAMRKYGAGIFHIEQIEECDNDILDEREKYWIAFYDSKNNGYNSTIGGTALPSGKKFELIDIKEIYKLWDEGYSLTEIHNQTGRSVASIREHLVDYPNFSKEESIKRGILLGAKSRSNAISQWDLNGTFIKTYESTKQAAKETNIDNQNINAVLHKKRKTAGNYYWTYENKLPIIQKKKKIYQYDKSGKLIKIFNTKAEAAKELSLDSGSIAKVCQGKRKTCGGYIWIEKEENENE